jgi:hypothetical protein
MRGLARVGGQSPEPLTPTLSQLKRGEGVLRDPGRGFNLFKALRRDFRALAVDEVESNGLASVGGQSPEPLTPTLSPLKRGEGVGGERGGSA